MQTNKFGILAALGAYVSWGFLPLYWHLLAEAEAYEILANRITWTAVFMLGVIVLSGRWPVLRDDLRALRQNMARLGLLLAATLIISINWLVYIWAVNHQHVIDTSIGYYINPLVNVLLGIVCFHERLTRAKWLSVALAACGILFMTWELGTVPWVALVLAVSFAAYGAVKKKLAINPFSGIMLETVLLLPVAVPYLLYLAQTGAGHFTTARPDLMLIFLGGGALTGTPLVLFSYGANLLPLNVLGFFQYISPTLGLLLGVFFFGEPLDLATTVALACIWTGVVIFTVAERKG